MLLYNLVYICEKLKNEKRYVGWIISFYVDDLAIELYYGWTNWIRQDYFKIGGCEKELGSIEFLYLDDSSCWIAGCNTNRVLSLCLNFVTNISHKSQCVRV